MTNPEETQEIHGHAREGSASEVFWTFLRLGLTSFGGPIAHLGYYRTELVHRRKWIDEAGYADLVALCQFLPGPASSQVGFGMGWLRAGPLGAIAAWIAFTTPSAFGLIAFAYGAAQLDGPLFDAFIQSLKVVAVAVVAHAVLGMVQSLCPDRPRATIGVAAALIALFTAGSLGQIAAIITGAVAGFFLLRNGEQAPVSSYTFPVPKRIASVCFAVFVGLLMFLPITQSNSAVFELEVFDAFYRAGALVFGGGHVVLPLLEGEVVQSGWVSSDVFLAGYGAAQAIPGPIFAFAAYLGASMTGDSHSLVFALIALIGIFLPGFLILVAALPFWNALRTRMTMQAAMRGANAAVVGILGAALYNPLWTTAILTPQDFGLALFGFALLAVWQTPSWAVVIMTIIGGMALSVI